MNHHAERPARASSTGLRRSPPGRLVRLFVLALALPGAGASAWADAAAVGWLESEPLDPVEVERREVKLDDIDTEDFRVGVYGGALSVQDFGVERVEGVTGAYHVTEDIYLEGVYFRSKLGLTSFERLSGGARLLTEDERDLTHYGINVGIDLLPGESHIGPWAVVNSALYLVGGVGSTDFGGDERFTVTVGVGYRLLATDWFALHVDVRDHLLESDLLGENETLHNFAVQSGFTVFF
jgi:outer membrane beta-barrel protein